MTLQVFVVDAFESGPFTGNPAAVVPLDDWIEDDAMGAIAAEHNLSETAFFVPSKAKATGVKYELRWFTPSVEVDLCGHATLATAHVLFEELGATGANVSFATRSGILTVDRGARLRMSLPAELPTAVESPPDLLEALGTPFGKTFEAAGDYVVAVDSSAELQALTPAMPTLAEVKCRAVLVTAPGEGEIDYVSRVFAPALGIPEDPATGSAHCALAPFWGERLGVTLMRSRQLSRRGGHFTCELPGGPQGDRVFVAGSCRTYLRGTLEAA